MTAIAPEAAADIEKAHFFLSRAGADKAFAARIAHILEDAGYSVILQDWDFADKNFVERMHDALIRSARVILCFRPSISRANIAPPNG
jgi:hypothetical protein